MSAVDDLSPDLGCCLALSDSAEIRRSISADTKNGMTAFAPSCLEDNRATLARIRICGIESIGLRSDEGN